MGMRVMVEVGDEVWCVVGSTHMHVGRVRVTRRRRTLVPGVRIPRCRSPCCGVQRCVPVYVVLGFISLASLSFDLIFELSVLVSLNLFFGSLGSIMGAS